MTFSFAFFKKKIVWIPLILVLLVGGYFWRAQANKGPFYDTQPVVQGDLRQTVEVTGEVKPLARLDLSFKTSGKLKTLNVITGQKVKQGDVLATLDNQEAVFAMRRAAATLAQMQANLASRQAQDSPQAIQMAEATRDQAKASYEKAQSDLQEAMTTSAEEARLAQIALDTAQQNLTNSGNGVDLTVQTSYESLRTGLNGAANAMSSALAEGDAIIGIENTGANDTYESVLGVFDQAALQRAKNMYVPVRSAQRRADALIRALSVNSAPADVLAAGQATREALQQIQWYLDEVQKVLIGTATNSGLSITELSTKRSSIQTWRATIGTQFSTIAGLVQTIQTTENSQTTTRAQLTNALKTAQANLTIALANQRSKQTNAQTTVEIQRAALSSAEAALSQRKTPARNVDLLVLRAQVQDASIAYEEAVQRVKDTELTAPIDGMIADIVPSGGEQVVQNNKVMGMVATDSYTVEALIPEADIAKVVAGQPATLTLDAYGDEVKFTGHVLTENPDRSKVQDAIYYKVIVSLDKTDRDLKPGMTANLIILTAEKKNTLIIPIRAVRTENDQKKVRVYDGKTATDAVVELGLRGDEGKTEVTSGLSAGQQVIVGELTAAEAAAKTN
jgi:HlyD family secretion protein